MVTERNDPCSCGSGRKYKKSPHPIVLGHWKIAFSDFFRDAHHRVDSLLDLGDLRMHFLDKVVFDP